MTEEPSRPVGPPVDSSPAQMPGPVTLAGRYGRVERLSAERHTGDFWEAVRGHDAVWDYIPAGPFSDREAFAGYMAACEQSKTRYFYAVIDGGGRTVGILALMEIRPDARVVEVGNIVYSPALQRTPLATEAQYLVARYAFETLRYRRYEWKCNALNEPSRRAALRFGFSYEGLFRQHMIVKGRNRDTAWYSMLDNEWPDRRVAFERWLSPDNFDAAGKQKASLAALNAV